AVSGAEDRRRMFPLRIEKQAQHFEQCAAVDQERCSFWVPSIQIDDCGAPIGNQHFQRQSRTCSRFLARRQISSQPLQRFGHVKKGLVRDGTYYRYRSFVILELSTGQYRRGFLEYQQFSFGRPEQLNYRLVKTGAMCNQFDGRLPASIINRCSGKYLHESWYHRTRLFQVPLTLLDQTVDRKLRFHRNVDFGGLGYVCPDPQRLEMLEQFSRVIQGERKIVGDDGGRCFVTFQQGAVDALLGIVYTQQRQRICLDTAISSTIHTHRRNSSYAKAVRYTGGSASILASAAEPCSKYPWQRSADTY